MTRYFLMCRFNGRDIKSAMGLSEYSYWFVEQYFKQGLADLGDIFEVSEVRQIPNELSTADLVLSFAPPHQTPVEKRSMLTPVFAWEYGSLPAEALNDDESWMWPSVLQMCRGALVHSQLTSIQVESAARGLPVRAVVVPIFDKYESIEGWQPGKSAFLSVDGVTWTARDGENSGAEVGGIVYTYVLNPLDGRKRWEDAVSGFVAALRDEDGACLVLKLIHHDTSKAIDIVSTYVQKLGVFRCRIVIICGYLQNESYEKLVSLTTYAVNSSCGEGQCLPLIEYMSAGRPGVTPRHSAMADYVSEDNSFVVEHTSCVVPFPNDQNFNFRTRNFPVDWPSLVDSFRASFDVASNDLVRYHEMSAQARCSMEKVASIRAFRNSITKFGELIKLWDAGNGGVR